MIQPADKHPNLSATAHAIFEAKSALESAGDALQVEVAVRLCEAAETLSRVQESQERAMRSGVWVNHEQAAAHFGISKSAMYEAVKEGAPRHRMVGNVYAYNLTELEGYFMGSYQCAYQHAGQDDQGLKEAMRDT